MSKQLQIRNSTAEFLIFQAEDKAQGVQVFYKDETIWATQKAMATLFDVDRSVITKHLKNIFETGELQQDSVSAKFAHTAEDGQTYSRKSGVAVTYFVGKTITEITEKMVCFPKNLSICLHISKKSSIFVPDLDEGLKMPWKK